MRRLSPLFAALLAVLFAVALPAQPAAASCAVGPDDPQLNSYAEVIFTGELVANQTAKLGREREYTFRVTQVYKGNAYAEQLVATDNNSSVALELTGPGTFLVKADYPDGTTVGPVARLTSTSCSGTVKLADPAVVPNDLGAPRTPDTGSSRSVTSRFTGKLWIGAGVGCILLAVIVSRRNAGGRLQRP